MGDHLASSATWGLQAEMQQQSDDRFSLQRWALVAFGRLRLPRKVNASSQLRQSEERMMTTGGCQVELGFDSCWELLDGYVEFLEQVTTCHKQSCWHRGAALKVNASRSLTDYGCKVIKGTIDVTVNKSRIASAGYVRALAGKCE